MILDRIDAQFPGLLQDRHGFRGDATAVVPRGRFLELVDFLFQEGFQFLVDLTAVDWKDREPRFDVVYHWCNLASQERLRVKVPVGEGQALPSLVSRFKTADWYEREVWDMFGIPFEGHPELRRLLMWEDYPGHPLRKDYPLDGGDPFCTQDTGTSYAGGARSLQD
ncbi:MAG: NADH-quinone oxidoreductase subunit C [Acidobacteria bacterium]|nr:NADH-quinone oxidoreductase subunit C [Acidobacteriota bacterium]